MTITGNNFGPVGAKVMVDGELASSVTHSPSFSNTKVTFILPPGTKSPTSVLLMQETGSLSNAIFISYVQCQPGYYEASSTDYACTACPPGRYSSGEGWRLCPSCPAGFHSSSAGRSSCTPCYPGSYGVALDASTGPTSCTLCPKGKYSIFSNQRACQLCQPGTFTLVTGAQVCDLCPAGSYQNLAGGFPFRPAHCCLRLYVLGIAL
jgi:hypothetical protein